LQKLRPLKLIFEFCNFFLNNAWILYVLKDFRKVEFIFLTNIIYNRKELIFLYKVYINIYQINDIYFNFIFIYTL